MGSCTCPSKVHTIENFFWLSVTFNCCFIHFAESYGKQAEKVEGGELVAWRTKRKLLDLPSTVLQDKIWNRWRSGRSIYCMITIWMKSVEKGFFIVRILVDSITMLLPSGQLIRPIQFWYQNRGSNSASPVNWCPVPKSYKFVTTIPVLALLRVVLALSFPASRWNWRPSRTPSTKTDLTDLPPPHSTSILPIFLGAINIHSWAFEKQFTVLTSTKPQKRVSDI